MHGNLELSTLATFKRGKRKFHLKLIMGLMHSNPELSPLLLLRGENAVSLLKEMQLTHKTQTTTPGKLLSI